MRFFRVLMVDTSGIWGVALSALEDTCCKVGFREAGGVDVDVRLGVRVGRGCWVGCDGMCWGWAGCACRGAVVNEEVVCRGTAG